MTCFCRPSRRLSGMFTWYNSPHDGKVANLRSRVLGQAEQNMYDARPFVGSLGLGHHDEGGL